MTRTMRSLGIAGILALGVIGDASLRPGSVTVARADEPTVTSDKAIGLYLQTLTPFVASSLGLHPETKGAVVTEVRDGTSAQVAGLQTGDVIVEVDQKPVKTAEQAVARLGDRQPHAMRVRNGRGSRSLNLPATP